MTLASIKSFLADESGATAIEYSLIAALIAIALIAAFSAIGTDISEMFGGIGTKLDANKPT